jgi:CMP-N,N'-diacetyllegionaminic acid synthase
VARTEWLRRTRSFISPHTVAQVMPAERSIDIDTLQDFEAFAQAVAEKPHA